MPRLEFAKLEKSKGGKGLTRRGQEHTHVDCICAKKLQKKGKGSISGIIEQKASGKRIEYRGYYCRKEKGREKKISRNNYMTSGREENSGKKIAVLAHLGKENLRLSSHGGKTPQGRCISLGLNRFRYKLLNGKRGPIDAEETKRWVELKMERRRKISEGAGQRTASRKGRNGNSRQS